MLVEQLIALGLSKEQAPVYLALVEHGPMLLTEIARKTLFRRADLYIELPKMVSEGLVLQSPVGKRIRYTAADPSTLERKIEAQHEHLETIRGELKTLAVRTHDRPRFALRQGEAALQESLEAFMCRLKKDDVYLRFSSRRADVDFNKYLTPKYKEEDARKTPEHFVIANAAVAKHWKKKLNRAGKILPDAKEGPFAHNVNAYIYQDRTLFVDYSSETAFEVHHAPFTDFLRSIFKHLYDRL